MENASKALIIAGAILISIVIITLGIVIVRNVTGTINNNSNLSTQEIESFNSRFSIYEGNNVPGSQVNALIQAVYQQDVAAARDKTSQYITIRFQSVSLRDNGVYGMLVFGVEKNSEKLRYSKEQVKLMGEQDINSDILDNSAKLLSETSTEYELKVPVGKTYKVTTALNPDTGLIYRILVMPYEW